jgi:hypothetical protein
VVADAPLQPKWIVDALARIAASDFATLAAVAIAGEGERLPWLAAAYGRLDRVAFGADVAELRPLPAVPTSTQAAALELDVVIALGRVDDDALERRARYGVWRFCFGPDGAEPAPLAGLREVARGEPLSACGVSVKLAGQPARLAAQSWSRTFPHSVARNQAQFLPKAGELAYRALRTLHQSGPGWLERCRPLAEPARALPGKARLAADLGRIGGKVLRRAALRAACIEQWFLAFRFGAGPRLPSDLAGFTRIVPPKDRDWADPFALERNGRYYVFFEELPYAARKGHISMIELDAHGRWSPPVRVLERDYHLSYPFLLEHQGELYMIPESGEDRSVQAYRCVDFPLRWRAERVLLEGLRYVDATLHRDGARWWMFVNAAAGESRTCDDELHVFHAREPFGEWQPHARNPVRSDPRGSRPAGALYREEGALYRPAQVGVPRYGAGLSIRRVQRLTPDEFAELEVARIMPAEEAGLLGLHTVNRAGALTVVDAFTRRWRL